MNIESIISQVCLLGIVVSVLIALGDILYFRDLDRVRTPLHESQKKLRVLMKRLQQCPLFRRKADLISRGNYLLNRCDNLLDREVLEVSTIEHEVKCLEAFCAEVENVLAMQSKRP